MRGTRIKEMGYGHVQQGTPAQTIEASEATGETEYSEYGGNPAGSFAACCAGSISAGRDQVDADAQTPLSAGHAAASVWRRRFC